ncbi:MAG: 30S ribosomal protein S18 [Patescibacteria group bacterium]|nr:MAG: 30S ribosomal protein S18 [Candidatus Peregrinibacteria bacterium RIFCSPLOWO2_01_FULL_39_12]
MPTYKHRKCYFCTNQINYVDYKNLHLLRKYISQYAKIVPRYYSGNCLKHQKRIALAVKNARTIALLPFVR